MPYVSTAFGRVLEPLDRHTLSRAVATHDGNRGVGEGDRAWTCQRHLKALVFAQIAGLGSLRRIVEGLSARPEALYHLGLRLPKRATLSDASRDRPSAVFRDVAAHLMDAVSGRLRREGRALTELIDASPIPLTDARFAWPESGDRVRGLKLYAHYLADEETPVMVELRSPRQGDNTLARAFVEPRKGATYVFDRGFDEYAFWQRLHEGGAFFVTRIKKNAARRETEPVTGPHPAPVLEDSRVRVGGQRVYGGKPNPLRDTPLREIAIARDGQPPLRLVTNDLSRSAEEIGDLYRQRWRIELFFKWIKQNLRIKSFWGRSENAVKIQLYVALIAFMLLRIAKDTFAKSHKGSLREFLTRIGVALLSPVDLTNRAKPPPRPPSRLPQTAQIAMQFGA